MNQSYELMLFLAKVSSKEELIKMLSDRTEKYASIPECDKEEAFRAISAICSLVITKYVLSSKDGAARLEASMEEIEDKYILVEGENDSFWRGIIFCFSWIFSIVFIVTIIALYIAFQRNSRARNESTLSVSMTQCRDCSLDLPPPYETLPK